MNTRDFGADQPATYILSARRLWREAPGTYIYISQSTSS